MALDDLIGIGRYDARQGDRTTRDWLPSSMSTPSPNLPTGVVQTQDKEGDGGGGFERFQQVMQTVLPALAAMASYRMGALGSFTESALNARNTSEQFRQQQEQFREQGLDRREGRDLQRRQIERQEEADRVRAEQEAAEKEAQKQRERIERIERALRPFEENPLYADGIPASVAENTTITVPGLGRISLKEAFDLIGVVQDPDGKYQYGKPTKKPEEKKPSLVTGIGPGGKPTRVPDESGTEVYERPRVPRQESKPSRPQSNVTTTTDEGYTVTYRVTFDEQGNVLNRVPVGTNDPAGIEKYRPKSSPSATVPSAPRNDPLGIRR